MALIYLLFPNDISPTFKGLIILWMLHTLTFVYSLIIRNKKLKKARNFNKINLEANKIFIRTNRLVNILCLLFAFYLIVIRYTLRWQLRVDLIYIYIFYFFFFTFLDFAFNVYGFKTTQPIGKALARKRNVNFICKRNIYFYLRVIYLFLGWVAFIFLPGVFVTGYLLLTPDSGIHIKIVGSWPIGSKQQVFESLPIENYKKYIDYGKFYDLPIFPFFRYHPSLISSCTYPNNVIFEMHRENDKIVIYDQKFLIFKKFRNIIDSDVGDNTLKPFLIGIDSFYQWQHGDIPLADIPDTLTDGLLIYKPKDKLAYKSTSNFSYILSKKKLVKK